MKEIAYIGERIRSPVAEDWYYPGESSEAAELLRSFGLERGRGGRAQAILAPHGAWELSGALAARAFAAAAGREGRFSGGKRLSRVVLLGTIHDAAWEGLFLSDSAAFETPLGTLPVDTEASGALAAQSSLFEFNDIPHLGEHSLEILLPLVKFCFPRARIVPILMGGSRPSLISGLGRALKAVFEAGLAETLFVISCNLSSHRDGDAARAQAEECVRLLGSEDVPALLSAIQTGVISACGAPLAAGLLESGLLAGEPVRLSGPLANSGDGEGNTVYYGALSFG